MITVQIKHDELTKLLTKMKQKGRNMRPLMHVLHGKMHVEVMKNFRYQSAPPDIFKHRPSDTRKAWAPLSDYSNAYRSAAGTTGTILEGFGNLKGSMGKVRNIQNFSVEYGTFSGISAMQHFGGIIKPKRAKHLTLPAPGVTGRARDYPNSFVVGKTIRQSGSGDVLFYLVDQVKIPARPHITLPAVALNEFRNLTFAFLTGTAKGMR